MCAAVLYISCRTRESPLPLKAVASALCLEQRHINKAYKVCRVFVICVCTCAHAAWASVLNRSTAFNGAVFSGGVAAAEDFFFFFLATLFCRAVLWTRVVML